ncbi:alpha/beta-Hydrolases superfamily protein [Artemisia annua]|uniref:Alpha/beta-Hydrolases superfamily protein n=1 Tax=Artemisia annua TaxID=35608 RepID=A0A2U1MPS2_ARTAN|nr:alpha/beta-Hydrolases superfamily protein [Artemisia annua]
MNLVQLVLVFSLVKYNRIGITAHEKNGVFVVGHDWGATAAWHLSLFMPDRVKGMVAICVPFFPRNPDMKPTQFFKSFGDDLYISQFQLDHEDSISLSKAAATMIVTQPKVGMSQLKLEDEVQEELKRVTGKFFLDVTVINRTKKKRFRICVWIWKQWATLNLRNVHRTILLAQNKASRHKQTLRSHQPRLGWMCWVTVAVNTVIEDENKFLAHIIKSTNMKCLTAPNTNQHVRFTTEDLTLRIDETQPLYYNKCRTCGRKLVEGFPHWHCQEPGEEPLPNPSHATTASKPLKLTKLQRQQSHALAQDRLYVTKCTDVLAELENKNPNTLPNALRNLENIKHVFTWNTDAWWYGSGTTSLYQSHHWVLAILPNGEALGILADTTTRLY